jgi:hypothetical protein
MTDELLPTGRSQRPATWGDCMLDTLSGRLPFLPSLPSASSDGSSPAWPQAPAPLDTSVGLVGNVGQAKEAWDVASSGWLGSALAPGRGSGLLGQLSRPADEPASGPWIAADEAALAQQAYDASAKRIVRGVRGRAAEPYEPPARDPEAEAAEPGLLERVRLNGVDSFYRSTLTGASNLALMQHFATVPDEPGIDPQTKRWRNQLRQEYPQVVADLARYDRMRWFENRPELAAAALGQLGGGLPTPESLVGVGAKGATWLGRAVKAGLQQGAVNAATDPIVQGLNINAGAQEKFDEWRPAIAGALGFVTGAAARSAAAALGSVDAPAIAARLTGHELGESTEPGHLRTLAREYAKNNLAGRAVTNRETGLSVTINWQGLRKATSGDRQETLLKLVPAIPDMLEQGRYLGIEKDRRGRPDIKAYHLFDSGAELAGTPHRTILFVRETIDGRFFYDFGIPNE